MLLYLINREYIYFILVPIGNFISDFLNINNGPTKVRSQSTIEFFRLGSGYSIFVGATIWNDVGINNEWKAVTYVGKSIGSVVDRIAVAAASAGRPQWS